MLQGPGDVIELAVFKKLCAGLMVVEADAVFHACAVNIKYPFIIAGSGIGTGFSAN
jgi:hypothetical protein